MESIIIRQTLIQFLHLKQPDLFQFRNILQKNN